jgi:hypothetical protein
VHRIVTVYEQSFFDSRMNENGAYVNTTTHNKKENIKNRENEENNIEKVLSFMIT